MVPVLLTIQQTKIALGVGRTKIYALMYAGELESIKIGTRTLITVRSIQAFLAARVQGGFHAQHWNCLESDRPAEPPSQIELIGNALPAPRADGGRS